MKRWLVSAGALLSAAIVLLIFALPGALPKILSSYRPDISFAVPTEKRQVFITIDDAPSADTKRILAILKKHSVPATFFIVSSHVTADAQLEEIVRAGHSLGNHLQSTKACSKLSLAEFESSFDACATTLASHGGAEFFRPPSDFGTPEQMAHVRSKGFEPVMGTVFPLDHWLGDPACLVRLARWLATPGGIVILHDGARRATTTAEVLDRLIPELRDAGYSFGCLTNQTDRAAETD